MIFSPLNLIYSTYPMAELNVCRCLAARTDGGSDGTVSILVEEWEDCFLLGYIFRARVTLIQTKLFSRFTQE